ncbi:hypothetical protein DVH05_009832 [Phytophthora capsici]|nr:hypothetical protein DVH05_009832 [Phytophthora capsici]
MLRTQLMHRIGFRFFSLISTSFSVWSALIVCKIVITSKQKAGSRRSIAGPSKALICHSHELHKVAGGRCGRVMLAPNTVSGETDDFNRVVLHFHQSTKRLLPRSLNSALFLLSLSHFQVRFLVCRPISS